jgi:plasmid stabilization system protein ParE
VRALRLLPEVEEELAQSARWYESKRRGLGIELVAIVDRTFDEIRDAPEAAPVWRADRPYRKKAVRRFPYVVFYRFDDDVIEIVAVAHEKRSPGYWLRRPRR